MSIVNDYHGSKTGWGNHKCRCGPCVEAKEEYHRERAKIDPARRVAEREALPPMPEVRVPVNCLDCGGGLSLLAPGRPTDRGSRLQLMLKRLGCGHELLFTATLQSRSGSEFAGPLQRQKT